MQEILEKIMVREIVAPILIIFFSFLTYLILSMAVKKLFRIKIKKVDERKQKALLSLVRNIMKVFIFLIALMMILEIYKVDTKSLVASLGVVSLVIGLALQDLIKDFIVGFTVMLEDQFSVGDTVTINGFTGTVIFSGLKTTRIKAGTGEIKIISNRTIIEVTNHTLEVNKINVDIAIEPASDIQRAEAILKTICEELSAELNLAEKAVSNGVESIADTGIIFRIVITANYGDMFGYARTFRARIKEAFDREGIKLAQPRLVAK
jgi:small conductance mechanosensitive channel